MVCRKAPSFLNPLLPALEELNLQQRRGRLAFLNQQRIHVAKFFADGEKQVHQIFRHLRQVGWLPAQFQFQQMPQSFARLAQTLVSGVESGVALVGGELFRRRR